MKFSSVLAGTTPSVKGIYSVLFLTFFTSAYAQVEKKDTSAFYRWEVGFDLEPLFREEEPYNLLVKRFLTKRKSLRVGIGVNEISNSTGEQYEVIQYLGTLFDTRSKLQYIQNIMGAPQKSSQLQFSIGFQYNIVVKKVIFYSATDLVYSKRNLHYEVFAADAFIKDSALNITTFEGYDPLRLLIDKQTDYALKQSFGLQYSFNRNLSISFEASFLFQYRQMRFEREYKPFPTQIIEKHIGKIDQITKGVFEPISGIFLIYHF